MPIRHQLLSRATALVALLAPALSAQSLADRVNGASASAVQFTFAARPGVCGNGRTYIMTGNGSINGNFYSSDITRTEPCVNGPVRVVIDRAGRDIIGPAYYDAQGNMTPCDEPQGARHLGVQNMAEACMQGRGVMIDLEAHFGRTGHIVSHAELMDVMRNDHVTVEPGDFVLFRTGFAEMLLEMNKQPDREKLMAGTVGLDGRDPKLQQWVTDSGAVALISDNFAVESMPARPCMDDVCATLPLHAHCLFKLGCYLGEMFYLTELADWLRANNRSRFLLTAPPLRLPGAVGSPATPVATV